MIVYTNVHLVKSEDLNHHDTLFAARGCAWIVEAGLTAAACEHGNLDEVVMRTVSNLSFSKPVPKGTMLSFESRVVQVGTSSITVYVRGVNAITGEQYIEAFIVYVTVHSDMSGKKAHGIILDETTDEEELLLRKRAAQLLKR